MARDVRQLHPRLQEKIVQLQALCNKEGLRLGIAECFRSVSEQNALYAQGRTKPGSIVTNAPGSSYSSQHQWGIAFDFYKNVKGHAYDDDAFFRRVGQLGKSIGLGWGGDWHSIVDKPHLYLPDWGSGTSILKQRYGNFANFKKTWGSASVTPITPPPAPSNWHATGTATCGGSNVNVRTTPNGAVIGRLDKGNRFEIDGHTDGAWTHVKASGQIGWMSTQYVRPDQPAPKPQPKPTPKPQPKPVSNSIIRDGQIHAINYTGANVAIDGKREAGTKKAGIKCFQQAANMDYNAGIKVDGLKGSATDRALSGHTVRVGESQEMVRALQINLMLNGYDPKGVDGSFGSGCHTAVIQYQKDHELTADGIAGKNTFNSLMS